MLDQKLIDELRNPSAPLGPKDILIKLRDAGYNESYETQKGTVAVKVSPHFEIHVRKMRSGQWQPDVTVNWLSVYVIVPTVLMVVGLSSLKIGGVVIIAACTVVSFGLANLFLYTKGKKVAATIAEAIK